MLGAYSLLKVIESELQAYLSATKGRVVSKLLVFVLFVTRSASFIYLEISKYIIVEIIIINAHFVLQSACRIMHAASKA